MKAAAALKNLLSELSPKEIEQLVARRGKVSADTYLDALTEDIHSAIQRLEGKRSKYHRDDEEKITSFIAVQLVAQGHNAECEADNSGHVDLKVTKDKLKVLYLAEAKVHRSYPKNIKGMLQLLTRYASGKERRGGFLLYIQSPGAKKIVEVWRKKVRCKNLRCGSVSKLLDPGVFESVHKHDSGHQLLVRHFGVFLHYDPKDASKKTGKKKKKKKK